MRSTSGTQAICGSIPLMCCVCSWLCLLTVYLVLLCPFAIAAIVHQAIKQTAEVTSAPYYMIVVMLWFTIFTERLKRKMSELTSRWGLRGAKVC